jgi:hypothetical protein
MNLLKKIIIPLLVAFLTFATLCTVCVALAEETQQPSSEAAYDAAFAHTPSEGQEVAEEAQAALPTVRVRVKSFREDGRLAIGDKVALIAEFDGDASGLSMQWQVSRGGSDWQNVSGETETTYVFTVSEENKDDMWRLSYK